MGKFYFIIPNRDKKYAYSQYFTFLIRNKNLFGITDVIEHQADITTQNLACVLYADLLYLFLLAVVELVHVTVDVVEVYRSPVPAGHHDCESIEGHSPSRRLPPRRFGRCRSYEHIWGCLATC